MNRQFLLAACAAAVLSSCTGADVRYAPNEAPAPLARERLMLISSIGYKDASGGVKTEKASVSLKRPFFETFKDAAKSRLDALNVQLAKRGGTVVEIELAKAEIKGGSGGDVTATVTYAVAVRGGLDVVCRQEASAWAVSRPGLASSPSADALQKALVKAVDKLGPTITESCLYSPVAAVAAKPAAARDPKALAIVVGIERYREGPASANFAESDARAAAEAAKGVLGAGDDRLVLLLGERATLADFQKYFERWLPAHAGAGAKVFVYFAGNGAPEGRDGAGYLLPYDADPEFLAETAFPLERLYAALAQLPGGATVALDACFSGTGARTVGAARGESPVRPPAGVTVISAGRTCGLDKDGGLFTRAFLKALKEREGGFKAAYDLAEPEMKKAGYAPSWAQGQ